MANSSLSYRLGATLILAAALGGLAVALYHYFVPLSGVTGSGGALLVIASSVLIGLAALILPALSGRGMRNLFRTLILLGILGTALAGALLHEIWLVAAMVLAFAGLLIDLSRPARRAPRPTAGGAVA